MEIDQRLEDWRKAIRELRDIRDVYVSGYVRLLDLKFDLTKPAPELAGILCDYVVASLLTQDISEQEFRQIEKLGDAFNDFRLNPMPEAFWTGEIQDGELCSWYGVSYVLETLIQGEHHGYEENILLMKVSGPGYAEDKAREEAAKVEQSYENVYGQTVELRVKEILLVYPVADYTNQFHGMEVLSRHIDAETLEGLRRGVPVEGDEE